MRYLARFLAIVVLSGCAARGSNDEEVRAHLGTTLAEITRQISAGDVNGFLSHVAPDATIAVRGIRMGTGDVLNTDVEGIEEIRNFIEYVSRPPDFQMTAENLVRSGASATQTGRWSIGGEQRGTFEIIWRNNGDEWQLWQWRLMPRPRTPDS